MISNLVHVFVNNYQQQCLKKNAAITHNNVLNCLPYAVGGGCYNHFIGIVSHRWLVIGGVIWTIWASPTAFNGTLAPYLIIPFQHRWNSVSARPLYQGQDWAFFSTRGPHGCLRVSFSESIWGRPQLMEAYQNHIWIPTGILTLKHEMMETISFSIEIIWWMHQQTARWGTSIKAGLGSDGV